MRSTTIIAVLLFFSIALIALLLAIILIPQYKYEELQKSLEPFEQIKVPYPSFSQDVEVEIFKIERDVFDLVNAERTERGLYPLDLDARITQVAKLHSQDMALRNYFEHESPEGKDVSDRFKEAGIYFICSGENLFFIERFSSRTNLSKEVVDGWMNSTGHRANILNMNYTDAGVGVFCEDIEQIDRRCYVTMNYACFKQDFGTIIVPRFAYFYPLVQDFDYVVPLELEIISEEPIDVYLVPSQEEQQKFSNRKSFRFFDSFLQTNYVKKEIAAAEGYGIMITSSRQTQIEIKLN
ncbi:MAG: CAP domain-containing protein, partial [Nanoarchaeota archaeon]